MIELKSIEGPDALGPNRYKVANPVPDPYVRGDYGLSSRNVLLNGELVYVHHVAHKRLDTYPKELVIVVKPEVVKRLQCKDIPDLPILEFLHKQVHLTCKGYVQATARPSEIACGMPSVRVVMPMVDASNWKLAHAKMNQLIRRKLVRGTIGFNKRGEYIITQKGLEYLQEQKNIQALYEIHPIDFL